MATMTRKRMLELARQARRHGYFRRDDREGYVRCPLCREDVTGYRDYDRRTWKLQSMTAALDAGMVAHLAECESSDVAVNR